MHPQTYSIIIPHKNCPELLIRCLDSIPHRVDTQIIVVDDNSDEGKKPIINRNDTEVVFLDQRHANGAGRARNVGLDKAQGKWLLFADADDYFTNYFPTLLDIYANDEVTDIVYLNSYKYYENGSSEPLEISRHINNYLKEGGSNNTEKALRYGYWTPWSRMVKRDLVRKHNLRFEEIPAWNDVMFGLLVSKYSNTIKIEKNIVYMYHIWPHGSLLGGKRRKLIEYNLEQQGARIAFYNKEGYHTSLNLLNLIEGFIRENRLSVKQAVKLYNQCRRKYHINGARDIARYMYVLIVRRIPRKVRSSFSIWGK